MRCPFCRDLENRVIDSRLGKEGDVIRRRRECEQCGRRFTTYERVEEALPLVVKKDGRREPFDRAQDRRRPASGPARSGRCRSTPSRRVADRIERQLQERGEKEVAELA